MLRPKISTNLAISADGKISSSPPRPSGWTSSQDHSRLLALRKDADALLVGRGTLEADCMTLTVPGKNPPPLRCIVSRTGNLNGCHPLFTQPGGEIHLLVTGTLCHSPLPGVTLHQESLASFLTTLASRYGVKHLHCEGGGELIRALADLDVIDEFHLTLAGHTLFGGLHAPTATGIPATSFIHHSVGFQLTHFESHAPLGECFLSYLRKTPAKGS